MNERWSDSILMDLLPLTVVYFLVNFGGWLWYALWGKYLVLDLGYSGGDLGLFSSIYNLAYALATFPSGRASDLTNPKRILSLGAALISAGTLILAYSVSYLPIILACILMGVGEGAFFTSAAVYAVKRGGLSRAGLIYGVIFSAGLLGEISGSLASGYVIELFGDRGLFLASAITTLSALPVISLARGGPEPAARRTAAKGLLEILREHREFRLLALGLLFHSASFNAIISFISVHAGEIGLSDTEIGLVNFTWLLSMLLATAPWGSLADRIESRIILTGHLALSFLSWTTYAYSQSFFTIIAAAIFMGIVSSMDMPARRKLVAELERGYGVGALIGALDLITMLSAIPAPLIGGLVYQALGLQSLFLIFSTINLLGIPFLLWMRRG